MTDLLSLTLLLRPLRQAEAEKPLPRWWGRAAHRLLLETLKLSDDGLSEAAHEGSELRPFTTSTLYGSFPNHQLDLAGNYHMRFTVLNQSVVNPLTQAVQAGGSLAPGAVVSVDHIPFEVLAAHYENENGTHPLASQTTYQELAAASLLTSDPAPRQVHFVFASPATFHARGRQLPYPLPELVIGSLLDKWNAFAPIGFPEEARQYASKCLAVSRFELKSRKVSVAGGTQTGFIGRVAFSTLNYDRYWMSLMQTLARFAYFSGIGAKTTMGMGQCRLPLEREERSPTPAAA